jgi:hypothetical protein
MDEPEEAPELEQTLFGIADPVGAVIGEDEIDEEAVEGELDEDMLSVADEDEDELAGELGDEPAEEPISENDIGEDEP